jgi:hypothetical protein
VLLVEGMGRPQRQVRRTGTTAISPARAAGAPAGERSRCLRFGGDSIRARAADLAGDTAADAGDPAQVLRRWDEDLSWLLAAELEGLNAGERRVGRD